MDLTWHIGMLRAGETLVIVHLARRLLLRHLVLELLLQSWG